MKKFLLLTMLTAQILSAAPEFKADENLKTQVLPNGMTIAVYKNSEPPNRVSMRLLVKRGSAYELENERGLAHFLEHMAFNGTKHFPAGEMVEYFQRLGMAFGADTNAHTSFIETVYKLDMPEASPKLISDGLMLLRDYSDGMLLLQDAIDRERGVIIAEKDSRDTQDYRKAVKEIAHLFKGSVFPDRMPIGEESVIKTADRDTFEKFYRSDYRPENTVLIIVGDIDPEAMLKEAEKYFSDFSADKDFPARTADFGKLESIDYDFAFDAGTMPFEIAYDSTANAAKSYASVAVVQETNAKDSLEKRVRDMRLRALSNAISARYLRTSYLPESKISQGSAGSFEFCNFASAFIFNADAPVGKSADALEENFRQILSLENLSDAELESAKKKIYESIESDIKGKDTRKNQELANEITSVLSAEEVFTSPEDDLTIAQYALGDFSAKDAIALLKDAFKNSKVKVFLSDSGKEPEGLAKTVQEKYDAAKASRYDGAIFAALGFEFSQFGETSGIKSDTSVEGLGIRQILFENGVRLNVKSTDFTKDEVLMKISFGKGLLDIPTDKPEYFVAVYGLLAGGTKFQNFSEINAARYPLKMSLGAGVEGNSFHMAGKSTSKDFEAMARLAATYVADAGFREDGRETLMKYGESFYMDFLTNPAAKLGFITLDLIKDGIAKVPGSFDSFKKVSMAEIAQWMGPILKNSYMEISIVGDIDPDAAVALVAETFGAMPKRDDVKADPYAAVELLDAGSSISMTYETTDEPRSVAARLWKTFGREDAKKMRASNVLGAVFDDVLRKEAREKEGKVYSPFAYNNSSTWMKDVGFMSAFTFVVPQYNGEIGELLEKCAGIVSANISEDEFERAKIPLLKGVEANKRKNAYWLDAVLNLSQAIPNNIELAKDIETAYSNVSLDEVRELAREIFAQKPYKVTVMPEEIKE